MATVFRAVAGKSSLGGKDSQQVSASCKDPSSHSKYVHLDPDPIHGHYAKPFLYWLFQLCEPNLYMGNGWKSPFPSVIKWLVGCLSFQEDQSSNFSGLLEILPRSTGGKKKG